MHGEFQMIPREMRRNHANSHCNRNQRIDISIFRAKLENWHIIDFKFTVRRLIVSNLYLEMMIMNNICVLEEIIS